VVVPCNASVSRRNTLTPSPAQGAAPGAAIPAADPESATAGAAK